MTDNTQQKGIYVRQTYGYIYSGDLVSKAEDAVDTVTTLAEQVSGKAQTVVTKAGEVENNTTTAQNACTKAMAWATQLDIPVENGEYSSKYWALQAASIQADWTENDATKSSYIQHKPTLVSNLSDLSDVSITTPTEGASLSYDSMNNIWIVGGVKANTSLDNITATGKTTGSSLAMPSSTYEALVLGGNGDSYTAPANGWVKLAKTASQGQMICLQVGNGVEYKCFNASSNDSRISVTIPVASGETFYTIYTATGTTHNFIFIYAKGEEP